MAFFGMDERYAEATSGNDLETGRLVCRQDEPLADHYLFHQIRPEDIVFIKRYTPEKGLYILAAGVVLPGCIIEEKNGSYFSVLWLWRGEKHTVDPDDTYLYRGNPIYEEFDLAVQREIMDMLPDSGHDPFKIVMAAVFGTLLERPEDGNSHTGTENAALPSFSIPNT